jgi:biopolymer transport protein ExbB/TolQ
VNEGIHALLLIVAVVLYLVLGDRLWMQIRQPGLRHDRGLVRLLRVFTACLPLLGLLGTVAGMIQAFGALGEATPGTPVAQAASGGIGTALRATQLGIALALPAVLLQAFLRPAEGR